jgi:hypothetical protein
LLLISCADVNSDRWSSIGRFRIVPKTWFMWTHQTHQIQLLFETYHHQRTNLHSCRQRRLTDDWGVSQAQGRLCHMAESWMAGPCRVVRSDEHHSVRYLWLQLSPTRLASVEHAMCDGSLSRARTPFKAPLSSLRPPWIAILLSVAFAALPAKPQRLSVPTETLWSEADQ